MSSILASLNGMYQRFYLAELRSKHLDAPEKKLRAILDAFGGIAAHLDHNEVKVLCELPDAVIAELGTDAKERQDARIAEEHDL